jgi:hypothetical protein
VDERPKSRGDAFEERSTTYSGCRYWADVDVLKSYSLATEKAI